MANPDTTYRHLLQEFLRAEVSMQEIQFASNHFFAREVVQKMGQADLFTPCYHQVEKPKTHTLPLNFHAFHILIEEVARTRQFGLTLTIAMHVGVFLPLVICHASDHLREEIVQAALHGEILGTIASTEAEAAGSDFLGMQTTSTMAGQEIILHGHKQYITNVTEADYVVVFTRWQPGRHFTNHCAVLVPTNTPGIQRSVIPMAVMKTAVIGRIEFEQVKLDASYLLGRKGWGFHYFAQHIAVERLAGGIWAVIVAEVCLTEAQHYAGNHLVGTQTLWERGVIQHALAKAVTQVTMLRSLVEKTLALAENLHKVDDFYSASIKAAVAPMMETVIGLCLQLHGARGLEEGSELLQHLNDFRVFGVAGGSTEVMLDLIADLWAQKCAVALNETEYRSSQERGTL